MNHYQWRPCGQAPIPYCRTVFATGAKRELPLDPPFMRLSAFPQLCPLGPHSHRPRIILFDLQSSS
jgi:hypothetical protein